MQKVVVVVAMLAVLALTGIDAHAQYAPWCAYDNLGGTNCGFHSFSQCQAAISGIGGTCSRNPSSPGSESGRRPRY